MVIHASLITKHQGVPKTSLETRQKILFTGRMLQKGPSMQYSGAACSALRSQTEKAVAQAVALLSSSEVVR